jgi:hypothetical protein
VDLHRWRAVGCLGLAAEVLQHLGLALIGPGPFAVAAHVPDHIVGRVLVHPGGVDAHLEAPARLPHGAGLVPAATAGVVAAATQALAVAFEDLDVAEAGGELGVEGDVGDDRPDQVGAGLDDPVGNRAGHGVLLGSGASGRVAEPLMGRR